jgi:hypothetical protein
LPVDRQIEALIGLFACLLPIAVVIDQVPERDVVAAWRQHQTPSARPPDVLLLSAYLYIPRISCVPALLRGLLNVPRALITDRLRSYGVAQRELLPDVEHGQSRYLNNRAENSHRPTRRRERQMQRFKSPRQAQRFLSAHSFIYGHFRPRRHLLTALSYRMMRALAFQVWQEETCARNAA